jgi:hypothetical protein
MKIPFLMAAAALIGATTALRAQVFFNPTNEHFYRLTSTPETFADARATAQTVGGYLVSIDDAPEQAWIVSNIVPAMAAIQGANGRAWIGLSDEQTEGVFQWLDGDPLTYSNWAPGEPNSQGEDEDAGEIMVSGGQWNDESVDATRVAIVEIENVVLDDTSNGHFYVFTPGILDRASARAMAENLGGTLATIDDAAEAAFLATNLGPKIRGLGNAGVWIGLSDELVENTFAWDDGAPFFFGSWAANEPNDFGDEDGVELRAYGNDFRWNDVPLDTPRVGLVEITVQLDITAYNGPGSLRIETYTRFEDMHAVTVFTFNTSVGNGWFFGISPSYFEVAEQVGTHAPPFVFTSGSNAKFVYDIPSGIPAAISFAAVSVVLNDPIGFMSASRPVFFTTL